MEGENRELLAGMQPAARAAVGWLFNQIGETGSGVRQGFWKMDLGDGKEGRFHAIALRDPNGFKRAFVSLQAFVPSEAAEEELLTGYLESGFIQFPTGSPCAGNSDLIFGTYLKSWVEQRTDIGAFTMIGEFESDASLPNEISPLPAFPASTSISTYSTAWTCPRSLLGTIDGVATEAFIAYAHPPSLWSGLLTRRWIQAQYGRRDVSISIYGDQGFNSTGAPFAITIDEKGVFACGEKQHWVIKDTSGYYAAYTSGNRVYVAPLVLNAVGQYWSDIINELAPTGEVLVWCEMWMFSGASFPSDGQFILATGTLDHIDSVLGYGWHFDETGLAGNIHHYTVDPQSTNPSVHVKTNWKQTTFTLSIEFDAFGNLSPSINCSSSASGELELVTSDSLHVWGLRQDGKPFWLLSDQRLSPPTPGDFSATILESAEGTVTITNSTSTVSWSKTENPGICYFLEGGSIGYLGSGFGTGTSSYSQRTISVGGYSVKHYSGPQLNNTSYNWVYVENTDRNWTVRESFTSTTCGGGDTAPSRPPGCTGTRVWERVYSSGKRRYRFQEVVSPKNDGKMFFAIPFGDCEAYLVGEYKSNSATSVRNFVGYFGYSTDPIYGLPRDKQYERGYVCSNLSHPDGKPVVGEPTWLGPKLSAAVASGVWNAPGGSDASVSHPTSVSMTVSLSGSTVCFHQWGSGTGGIPVEDLDFFLEYAVSGDENFDGWGQYFSPTTNDIEPPAPFIAVSTAGGIKKHGRSPGEDGTWKDSAIPLTKHPQIAIGNT